jgi:hypothetical protein
MTPLLGVGIIDSKADWQILTGGVVWGQPSAPPDRNSPHLSGVPVFRHAFSETGLRAFASSLAEAL